MYTRGLHGLKINIFDVTLTLLGFMMVKSNQNRELLLNSRHQIMIMYLQFVIVVAPTKVR